MLINSISHLICRCKYSKVALNFVRLLSTADGFTIPSTDNIKENESNSIEIEKTTQNLKEDLQVNGERLSKYLASTGICSRREAEKWILDKRISIKGVVCSSVSYIVPKNQGKLDILVDGEPLHRNNLIKSPRLWIVYKARGELTSDKDNIKNRPLMLERINALLKDSVNNKVIQNSATNKSTQSDAVNSNSTKLVPINRLDFNTEGLCLVTNNGNLARTMNEEPTLIREYRARIHGLLNEEKFFALKKGIYLDGKKQKPIEIKVENASKTISWIRLSTAEASNRTVFNILNQMHLDITRMISVGFGPYKLEDIKKSGFSEVKLTPEINKVFISKSQNKRLSLTKGKNTNVKSLKTSETIAKLNSK